MFVTGTLLFCLFVVAAALGCFFFCRQSKSNAASAEAADLAQSDALMGPETFAGDEWVADGLGGGGEGMEMDSVYDFGALDDTPDALAFVEDPSKPPE